MFYINLFILSKILDLRDNVDLTQNPPTTLLYFLYLIFFVRLCDKTTSEFIPRRWNLDPLVKMTGSITFCLTVYIVFPTSALCIHCCRVCSITAPSVLFFRFRIIRKARLGAAGTWPLINNIYVCDLKTIVFGESVYN